jgi:hypothetical protein
MAIAVSIDDFEDLQPDASERADQECESAKVAAGLAEAAQREAQACATNGARQLGEGWAEIARALANQALGHFQAANAVRAGGSAARAAKRWADKAGQAANAAAESLRD